MGSCVSSVHKSRAESAMKLNMNTSSAYNMSKNDNLVVPESDTNNTKPPSKRTFDHHPPPGSKEEVFFDSLAGLDSDWEDDFFSVNGDFTPSRGTTPVHYSASRGSTPVHHALAPQVNMKISSEPSPTADKKKRLSELFKDSGEEDGFSNIRTSTTTVLDVLPRSVNGFSNIRTSTNEKKTTILDVLPRSANSTPYFSGLNSTCSSERTPNADALANRDKPMRASPCCIPSLVSYRSLSDRKKKLSSSVAINGNG